MSIHEQASEQYTEHRDQALYHLYHLGDAVNMAVGEVVAAAQVHATLALAAATTLREYTEPVPYAITEIGELVPSRGSEFAHGARHALLEAARTIEQRGMLHPDDVEYVTSLLRTLADGWAHADEPEPDGRGS